MKIVLVNHYVGRPTAGVGNRHYMLAKELMNRGHTVTIIASSFQHGTRTEGILNKGQRWKKEALDGVPFVWVKTSPYRGNGLDRIWNMLCFAYRVAAWIERLEPERPDIVVGSSPHLLAALAALSASRHYRVPFVLEIRDLWPESLIELGKMSPRNPGIRALERVERHLYKSADHIISLLPGGADHICEKGGLRDRVTWIPNGVDLRLIPVTEPPKGTGFTVIYAGAHGLANGLDSILDAAAILQANGLVGKVKFRFIGDGPEKARLEERARRENLEIVRFEPYVPRNVVFGYLQEADAFIVTLRNVGLYRYGISLNKLYDYLGCSRPVVFAANSLNNPVQESGGGVTVPPEDAEAMAKAITDILAMSHQERFEMGLRGRRYVEQHNDYGALVDKLEGVLHNLL